MVALCTPECSLRHLVAQDIRHHCTEDKSLWEPFLGCAIGGSTDLTGRECRIYVYSKLDQSWSKFIKTHLVDPDHLISFVSPLPRIDGATLQHPMERLSFLPVQSSRNLTESLHVEVPLLHQLLGSLRDWTYWRRHRYKAQSEPVKKLTSTGSLGVSPSCLVKDLSRSKVTMQLVLASEYYRSTIKIQQLHFDDKT